MPTERKQRIITLRTIAILALALFAAGCGKNSDTYPVTGYVEATLDEQNRLRIDHEEIPGYMPPMIMLFNVAHPEEAEKLVPGDQIQFTYHVSDDRSWIDGIQKTGAFRTPIQREPITPRISILSTGEALPDYTFLDEDGKTLSLSNYRGKVVALTFVFTRCPVPEYCPAMMRNFGNVDKLLRAEPPKGAEWQLATISFDPEYDSPEMLKQYGDSFSYDSSNWDLLTSETLEPIEDIAARVGLKFGKENGSYLHNLRTIVLDTEGKVFHIFTDETWSPEELAAKMRAAAAK